MNLSEVGQARAEKGGVEEEDMESKDDTMPSSSKVAYQVPMHKGVSWGVKGQEIQGFVEWQKMLSILGEKSSKVETFLSSLLKCKDVVHQNMVSMIWSYRTRISLLICLIIDNWTNMVKSSLASLKKTS